MIYEIFLNSLHKNPSATAIVTSNGAQESYLQVSKKVHQWANFFIDKNLSDKRVGILTTNEDIHVYAYLGLDFIHAIYVPLDAELPIIQLTKALEDLQLECLIIDEAIYHKDVTIKPNQIFFSDKILSIIDNFPIESQRPYCSVESDNKISYIMSSSGSTGDKKWIPIKGGGLQYWANVEREKLQLNQNDKILTTRSPAYDARISEYVRAFANGSCLILISATERKDLQFVITKCQKEQITCLLLISSQLNGLNIPETIAKLRQTGLRHLIVTGDACSNHLKSVCEENNVSLWNAYGPTEATFGLSILRINNISIVDENGDAIVPIGFPESDEVKCHIIDDRLYIESPYLSPGYLKATSDTSFPTKIINGIPTRVFDTGDRFCVNNDYLVYQGRHSAEVHCKVSGVKISPFMIEQTINSFNDLFEEEVINAVVVVKKWLSRDKPFAYIVAKKEFDKKLLADFLRNHLKKEEIPIIIGITDIPRLIPSQKVDRQKLIHRQDQVSDYFLHNQTTLEMEHGEKLIEDIKSIWCDLFNLSDISPIDDFLFLGGDSTLAIAMVKKIQDQILKTYRYSDLLSLPTININEIANEIRSNRPISSDTAIINGIIVNSVSKKNIFFLPPLLGEGFFMYKDLAKIINLRFDTNIYGLSDPAIYDEALLPESLEMAAKRYVKAIRTIQPEGPYELLGFSFGATLATEVARILLQQNEEIYRVHLLDALPPYLDQKLSTHAHFIILKSLVAHKVKIFQNPYYNESAIDLQEIDKYYNPALTKSEQVDSLFDFVEYQLQHCESKRVLKLARTHLEYMLTATPPSNKLPICPRLYYTDKSQNYLSITTSINEISQESADNQFYFWNRYYTQVRLSGYRLNTDHIGMISGYTSADTNPLWFWLRSPDIFYHINCDYAAGIFYSMNKKEEGYTLMIGPLIQSTKSFILQKRLESLGIQYEKNEFDRTTFIHSLDWFNNTLHSISCDLTNEQAKKIEQIMFDFNIKRKNLIPIAPRKPNPKKALHVSININTFWNSKPLHRFSIGEKTYSTDLLDQLSQLKITPNKDSDYCHFLNFDFVFHLTNAKFLEVSEFANVGFLGLLSLFTTYQINNPKDLTIYRKNTIHEDLAYNQDSSKSLFSGSLKFLALA